MDNEKKIRAPADESSAAEDARSAVSERKKRQPGLITLKKESLKVENLEFAGVVLYTPLA